jgi:hypothetical protein
VDSNKNILSFLVSLILAILVKLNKLHNSHIELLLIMIVHQNKLKQMPEIGFILVSRAFQPILKENF